MKSRTIFALIALTALACSKPKQANEEDTQQTQDPHAAFDDVAVDDVQQLLDSKQAVPVDANNPETRKEFGTVPGAVLLSNSQSFELSELPQEKTTQLIFYCSSPKCLAAPRAAAKAKGAGYASVSVMRAGIKGWVDAGKPVDQS